MLVAQCSQMLKNCEPLQTAKQFLRRWKQPGMNARQVAAKLLADADLAPPEGGGGGSSLVDEVAALVGGQQAGSSQAVVTFAAKRSALVTVLAALARKRPLMLCVEDSEHVDVESIAVLAQLLQLVDEGELRAPLLVVLAVRSSDVDVEAEEPWKSWPLGIRRKKAVCGGRARARVLVGVLRSRSDTKRNTQRVLNARAASRLSLFRPTRLAGAAGRAAAGRRPARGRRRRRARARDGGGRRHAGRRAGLHLEALAGHAAAGPSALHAGQTLTGGHKDGYVHRC